MKKKLQTILIFLLLAGNVNSQAAAPALYGNWILVSSSIDGIQAGIKGTFTESYEYETMEAVSNGSYSLKDSVVSVNCIIVYKIDRKSRSRFIQTITSLSGADCGESKEDDSMIVDYTISGNLMSQTIHFKNAKIVSQYRRVN
jgi:hypothetical protein